MGSSCLFGNGRMEHEDPSKRARMEPGQVVELTATDPLRWRAVRTSLDDFRKYLSPDVPCFPIVAANDFKWSEEEYNRLRPKGFPTKLNGVYLIFDEQEVLLYVGVSVVNFDKRVWSHDSHFKACGAQRRWTDIIVLPRECAFLGLSLEYFLICRLRPRWNTVYASNEILR